jgi:hypothetical protein
MDSSEEGVDGVSIESKLSYDDDGRTRRAIVSVSGTATLEDPSHRVLSSPELNSPSPAVPSRGKPLRAAAVLPGFAQVPHC